MAYLSDDLYQTVTSSVPLVCVDLIPVRRKGDQWNIGLITRATGSEKGKIAILGGRIYHDEAIESAIRRHLEENLGIGKFTLLQGNVLDRPFMVQSYTHSDDVEPNSPYDPTKHAIALTYLIEIEGEIRSSNEAGDFHWISDGDVPTAAAYNQHVVMQSAFRFLSGR